MKILRFIILLLFIGVIPLNAQKMGYINDEDGYTNLRLDKSGKSNIIGIIISGQELKYYPDSETDWWKVDFKFRTGYIHKSRIKDFNRVKTEVGKFFQDFYATDRKNVENREVNNEKLFQFTQNYPLATLTAFCGQRKQVQEFLVSEYESPIHDLIDLQLIYSRLINLNYTCSETYKITDAFKIAAGKLGQELRNVKAFSENIPDYNKPNKNLKNLALTNNWFVKELNEKPINFYLNHPEIDTYAKMFYQGQFAISDDTLTFAFLDSVLTNNQETQPFYLHVCNYAVKIADGALAEAMGSYCKSFFEKNTCRFIDLKTNKLYSDYYQKWIDFTAFEYYFEEKPYEAINDAIKTTRPSIARCCPDKESELKNIRLKLIEFIKENE